MTIEFRSLLKTLLSLAGACFAAGMCVVNSANAEPKPLRVATSPDNAPLIYQAEGKLVGMEWDLSRLLQSQLGQPLQFQILPRAELLPALARGEVDLVMAGLVITPQREQQVDFTIPYLRSGQMAVFRTEDVLRYRNEVELSRGGFRVGFIPGSAAADYVKANMAAATAVPCGNADECLDSLVGKRIDVLIDAPTTSWRIATEPKYAALMSSYRPLTEDYFAWAVAKNNTALRERIDNALHNMRRLQMFEHIVNRWVPVRISGDER